MTERAVSRPPPADLLKRIAAAKAVVSEREAERKAAWSVDGLHDNSILLRAWAYHEQHRLWTVAVSELRQLERQLEARQAHAQEAGAHE